MSLSSEVTGQGAAAEKPRVYLWSSVPAQIWLLAAGTVTLAIFVHIVIRYAFLDNMDEENYLWLARRILEGRVTAQTPPADLLHHFDVHWRGEYDGRLYTHFFFMWPLLLASGVALHVPWLVNPLLAGFTVLLCYLIVRNLYDDSKLASTTALLLAPCPFLVFQAGTMLSHVANATWCLAGALALSLYTRSPKDHYLLLAGLTLGFAFSTRPLETVAFSFPMLVAIAISQYQRPLQLFRTGVTIATGGITGIIPFLAYNHAITGNPLITPHQLHGSPLFATSAGQLAVDAIPKTVAQLSAWGNWFYPWWMVALVVLALIFTRALNTNDRIATGIIVAIVAVYTPFTTMFDIAGPRYHFLVLFPVTLIIARLLTLKDRRFTIAGMALVYAMFLHADYDQGRKMHWDMGKKRSLEVAIQQSGLSRAIILVPDGWYFGMYSRSLFKNEPDFSGIIYAADIPATNRELIGHFPGVPAYRWPSGSDTPPGRLEPYKPNQN